MSSREFLRRRLFAVLLGLVAPVSRATASSPRRPPPSRAKKCPEGFSYNPDQKKCVKLQGEKVICTELLFQGKLSPHDYRLCALDAAKRLSDQTYRGYHAWAVPAVRLMRRSPRATRFFGYLAQARVDEIAARLGSSRRSNLVGKFLIAVVEPMCTMTGALVPQSGYATLYSKSR